VRPAAATLLLLGACSQQPSDAPVTAATPTVTSSPDGATVSDMAATGSELRGQVSALHGDTSGLTTRTTAFGTVVELPTDTLFAFDRAELSPQAEADLQHVAELIRRAPPGPIAVTGHTDSKGDDAYNQALSERRANAVASWLRAQVGVRQREITVAGKGETAPVVPNAKADGSDDEAGRARNRRVELLLPRSAG
jgi:outer membrane protein OmpA-like peptidoglycan-associated protein